MDSHNGNGAHTIGQTLDDIDTSMFLHQATGVDAGHMPPPPPPGEAFGYAPTGPTDDIVVHPKMRGYGGFGKRVWWLVGGVLAVILIAFMFGAGFFKTPTSSNGTQQTIASQAVPAPVQTGLIDTKGASNALPVPSGAPLPNRGHKVPIPVTNGQPGIESANTANENTPSQSSGNGGGSDFSQQMRSVSSGVQPVVPDPNTSNPYPSYPANSVDTGAAAAAAQAVAAQQDAAKASMVVTATTSGGSSIATTVGGGSGVGSQGPASSTSVGSSTTPEDSSDYTGPTFTVWPGDILQAELDTEIYSDTPGTVLAHITQDVYDSMTGRQLLIPSGSRLIGSYSNNIGAAQTRMGVEWQMVVLPNGSEIPLGGLESADVSGTPGLSAKVDNHTGRVFKTTMILGGLAALAQLANPQTAVASAAGAVIPNQSVLGTVASAQAQQFVNSGTQMIQRDQSLPPTLTVQKNSTFTIIVNKKFPLRPYAATEANP